MKKQEHLPALSDTHREALARLAAHPDFKALEELGRIEERNIIIQSFKVNSGDPALAIRKSWHEGRIFELRKLFKTFEQVSHSKKE